MPIEDQVTLTPDEDKKPTDTLDGDLDAFFGSAAAVARERLAEQKAQEETQRPVIRSELTESGTTRIITNERGRKVIRGLVASAAGLGIVTASAIGIAANNAKMEDSKVVIGTDTFMPSFETGESQGQADAATNQILKDSGIDPNKISYEQVSTALTPALNQEKEVSGEILPGATFDATVYQQTDLFGGKHYSVDIDSTKYLEQQNTNKEK